MNKITRFINLEMQNIFMDAIILEKIGLTPGEAKIYLALLSLGQSTTGPIVDKSKVSTSKTYKILKRLESKGLVGHIIKNNTVHWSPANPRRIIELMDEQEKDIAEKKKEVSAILPDLLKKVESLKEKQQAEIYMGIKGMITVFNDETSYFHEHPLESNYVIGIASVFQKKFSDFFKRLEIRRDKLKIKRRYIFGIKAKSSQPWIEKSGYCEVRYLDYPDSPVSINIYGETSFICILGEEPTFFVIKSREIAESFKEYFKVLWKIAKEK